MSRLEAHNEREDLVIPFLLQAASIPPLLIHKSLGASVGRQIVGGSEVELLLAFSAASESITTQQSEPPLTKRGRPALQMAGFEPLLIAAKGEPVQMGKFSPKRQPEGPTFSELDIACGEQTGCLDPRAQTSCVTQPWCVHMGGGEEAACSDLCSVHI